MAGTIYEFAQAPRHASAMPLPRAPRVRSLAQPPSVGVI